MNAIIVGQPAPLFQLQALDGRRVSLADFRGQLVLLNFWSAECPWSGRADRVLRDWWPRLPVLNIASNASEPEDLLRRVSVERRLPLLLLDTRHEVADLYGALTTPHCFLIDSGGILRYQGAFDDVSFRQRAPTRVYVVEVIQALLAGQPAPVTDTPPYGCSIVRFGL